MQSKALREVERHPAMPDDWTGFTACRRSNNPGPIHWLVKISIRRRPADSTVFAAALASESLQQLPFSLRGQPADSLCFSFGFMGESLQQLPFSLKCPPRRAALAAFFIFWALETEPSGAVVDEHAPLQPGEAT